MAIPERRRAARLTLPRSWVAGLGAKARILDVSSAGVRIEVDTRCVFARGEHHRLLLSDDYETVEVEGQVRWTRSHWRHLSDPQGSQYFQIAGLAFSRLVSDRPAGIWSGLLRKTLAASTSRARGESATEADPSPTAAGADSQKR